MVEIETHDLWHTQPSALPTELCGHIFQLTNINRLTLIQTIVNQAMVRKLDQRLCCSIFCSCLCRPVHGEHNDFFNEAIVQQRRLVKSLNRTVEALISKISDFKNLIN